MELGEGISVQGRKTGVMKRSSLTEKAHWMHRQVSHVVGCCLSLLLVC